MEDFSYMKLCLDCEVEVAWDDQCGECEHCYWCGHAEDCEGVWPEVEGDY